MKKEEIVLNNLTVFTGNTQPIWDMNIKELQGSLYVTHFRNKNFQEYGLEWWGYNINKCAKLMDTLLSICKGKTSYGAYYLKPVLDALLKANKDDIVVIEYPETALSPSEISKLTKLICDKVNSGVKILLETYSDHIINGILVAIRKNYNNFTEGISTEDVSIYHFGTEEVTLLNITSRAKISNTPDGFFDQSSIDRKIILGFVY
jgi:hypothetical protein